MSLPTESYSETVVTGEFDTKMSEMTLWEDNLVDEITLESVETHVSHPMVMGCNELTAMRYKHSQERENMSSYQLLVVMEYCLRMLMADREDCPYPAATSGYGANRGGCGELSRSRKRPREQELYQSHGGSLSELYEVF